MTSKALAQEGIGKVGRGEANNQENTQEEEHINAGEDESSEMKIQEQLLIQEAPVHQSVHEEGVWTWVMVDFQLTTSIYYWHFGF